MSNVFNLRRTRDYLGKTIPTAVRTVIQNCGGDTDMGGPHVHLIGFSSQRPDSAEYEIVIGEDIARHIVAVMREQGCDV